MFILVIQDGGQHGGLSPLTICIDFGKL